MREHGAYTPSVTSLYTAGKRGRRLPTPSAVLAPAALVAEWESPKGHPHLKHLQKHAVAIMNALKKLAGFSFGTIFFLSPDKPDPEAQERIRALAEIVRAQLPLMRGTAFHIFERDLARHLGFIAPQYFVLREEAETKMKELLEVLSFLLESGSEGDAEKFIPAPRHGVKSGPSVTLKL